MLVLIVYKRSKMFGKVIFFLILNFILTKNYMVLFSEDIRKKESGYLLIHPKALVAGRSESICLSLHDVYLPIKVLIDVKIEEYHEIVTQNLYTGNKYSVIQIITHFIVVISLLDNTCFKILIKPEKVKYSQYGSLHLQIQLNGTIHSAFNNEPIFIIANDKMTFIETDKTTYKPNDVVKFRILILDNDMKPFESLNVSN